PCRSVERTTGAEPIAPAGSPLTTPSGIDAKVMRLLPVACCGDAALMTFRDGDSVQRAVDLGDTPLEAYEILPGQAGAQRGTRHAEWIHRPALAMQLEMQMGPGRQAAAAYEADHLALAHPRAAPNARRDARHMGVAGREAATVA